MKQKAIPPNQHVFIAGATGSGKSVLARNYLAGYDNVVCLDIKGDVEWPEVPEKQLTVVERLQDLPKVKTPKIIYRPVWDEIDFDTINMFFEWIYRRQNCIVWVDEVMGEAVSPNPFKIPPYYKAILTRGRSRNTAVWSCSQRPSGIAAITMSEASHFFVFRLNMVTDRAKIAGITGFPEFESKPPEFAFWYLNVREDNAKPKLGRLRLEKQNKLPKKSKEQP